MAKTHYETLGVSPRATSDQVRSAYRKLALAHHPDRSSSQESKELFLASTAAYEVLSDAEKRRNYDLMLSMQAERQRRNQETRSKPSAPQPPPTAPRDSIATELTRLSLAFSRGQLEDAERLARKILAQDSRQPIPHAVLGDIARGRGDAEEALRQYKFAVQLDPGNSTYLRRVEELKERLRWLQQPRTMPDGTTVRVARSQTARPPGPQTNDAMLVVGGALVLACAIYILLLRREPPIAPEVPLISSWTLSLCGTLFVAGLGVGATLCIGGFLDRFYMAAHGTQGRAGASLALGTVAIIQFWGAATLLLVFQFVSRSGHYATTRLMLAISATTLLMGMATTVSETISPVQVWLWGGNLIYFGAMCGWLFADVFARGNAN
ncbi:MAG: DnaJ domain-containing protein [Fimbriimonas sp.]